MSASHAQTTAQRALSLRPANAAVLVCLTSCQCSDARRARTSANTAMATALNVRLGLGGAGTSSPIDAMARRVACSLFCQRLFQESYSLKAHTTNQEQKELLL